MDSEKFQKPAQKILNCGDLLTALEENKTLIDKDLLNEYQKYASPINVQSTSTNAVESTVATDNRVKKLSEIENRLKSAVGNLKKKSMKTSEKCVVHKKREDLSERYLNGFMDQQFTPTHIDSDTISNIIEQHIANMDNIKKFCDSTMLSQRDGNNGNIGASILPALQIANNVTNMLREVDADIDFLNDSTSMYSGLSNDVRSPYAEEIKDLRNIF